MEKRILYKKKMEESNKPVIFDSFTVSIETTEMGIAGNISVRRKGKEVARSGSGNVADFQDMLDNWRKKISKEVIHS